MTNNNDYPKKLRFLTDEVKHYKERLRVCNAELAENQRVSGEYLLELQDLQQSYRQLQRQFNKKMYGDSKAGSEFDRTGMRGNNRSAEPAQMHLTQPDEINEELLAVGSLEMDHLQGKFSHTFEDRSKSMPYQQKEC